MLKNNPQQGDTTADTPKNSASHLRHTENDSKLGVSTAVSGEVDKILTKLRLAPDFDGKWNYEAFAEAKQAINSLINKAYQQGFDAHLKAHIKEGKRLLKEAKLNNTISEETK